jgi:hypothetical protein
MTMMTFSDYFVYNANNFISSLQGTQVQPLADKAEEEAEKATTPREVLKIFREFAKESRSLELKELVDSETDCLDLLMRTRGEKESDIHWERRVSIKEILMPGEVLIDEKTVADIESILSHPLALSFYRSAFGEPLMCLQQKFLYRKIVNTFFIIPLNSEILQLYKKLFCVVAEWEALPQHVRKLFKNVEASKILHDPNTFITALQAIHWYNLFCIAAKTLQKMHFKMETQQDLSIGAEAAASWLKDQGKSLTELDLSGAGITCLPIEVTEECLEMKRLILDRNFLFTLPPTIGNLKKLEALFINRNCLRSLPPQIGELIKLLDLRMENNNLASIPPQIGNLTGLITLYLCYNKLTSLPPEIWPIGSKRAMCQLSIRGNPITQLPSELLKNPSLYLDADLPLLAAWNRALKARVLLEEASLVEKGLKNTPIFCS